VMQPLGTGTLTRMNPDDQSLTPFRSFGCETWAQVLLKWVISDPRVHVAIPATSSVEHMLANARAGEEPLMDEEHRSLVEKIVKQGWKRTAA
jgi:aryl-alcohol dehydrogenase-like predicted oxidoreductase